jgi:SanA protein
MFIKRLKRPYIYVLGVFITCLVFIAACNIYINFFASPYLFTDTDSLPKNEFGLILGTSKYLENGDKNNYFHNRVQAAAGLYFSGKISQIICSGDNRDKYYNEPKALSKELQKLNVPDSVIWLDKKGISTNQSMQNFIEDYNTQSVTIITQKFHNQRAVFLARKSGLDAVGFIANDVSIISDPVTHIREWFAKVKAVLVITFN